MSILTCAPLARNLTVPWIILPVGASVAQSIFDGRTLLHRERAAKAAYTQASEQYRSTVLTAFQNVADTLNALQQDSDALKAVAAARDAAIVTLDLAKKQFQSGYVSTPTARRCFRLSAADGGTDPTFLRTNHEARAYRGFGGFRTGTSESIGECCHRSPWSFYCFLSASGGRELGLAAPPPIYLPNAKVRSYAGTACSVSFSV
jgi:type II secretory pathway pseudopilin PulG